MPRKKRRRWPWIVLAIFAAVVIAIEGCADFGASPDVGRLEKLSRKALFVNGRFANREPNPQSRPHATTMINRFLLESQRGRFPQKPLPVKMFSPSSKDTALRITWLGHSSLYIEMQGYHLLTDPMFSLRASPSQWFGPKRFHPSPLDTNNLAQIDAIIISHDHYDHLDYRTVVDLKAHTRKFVVPLGVGAHLRRWGVEDSQIIELDWWQSHHLNEHIELVATPAQHFSGRTLSGRNETLWSSWVLLGQKHRLYFGGDTGEFKELAEIGRRFGPFDYTMMPVGAYADIWTHMHMTPEQAVLAHGKLRGKVMIPIHWGTFQLAFHPWQEPVERMVAAALEQGVLYAAPLPGQTIEDGVRPTNPWWHERSTLAGRAPF